MSVFSLDTVASVLKISLSISTLMVVCAASGAAATSVGAASVAAASGAAATSVGAASVTASGFDAWSS